MDIEQASDVMQIDKIEQNSDITPNTDVDQDRNAVESQEEQAQIEPQALPQNISRRRLLAAGLLGGGVLALGTGGFALWKYQQRALKVIGQMNTSVSAVAWSPDGRSFAIGDGSGTIKVWQFAGQKLLYTKQMLTHLFPASLAWSPDGKYLIVGGDGNAHIWRAQTGKSIADYYFADRSFAWSPNGKFIASGGRYGLIQIWDPSNGNGLYSKQAYIGSTGIFLTINSIAWSPDSTHFATVGSQDGDVIALWDVATGQDIALPFNIHLTNTVLSRMNAIGWSPDSMHIAAGYADGHKTGRVLLWSWQQQTKTWDLSNPLPAHFQMVNGITWSPDSTRFASVGLDTKIQIWNMSSGLQMDISTSSKGLAESSALNALAWSPNGKYLLAGDDVGQILLWEVD